MSRNGEHINIHILNINCDMTDCLNGVGMEQNALFFTYGADFFNRLNCADLVVGAHNCYKSSILTDCVFNILNFNDAV